MATTDQVIKNLDKRIKDIESGKAQEACFRSAFNSLTKRLFDFGTAGDGQRIGLYSTKPIYVSQKQAPRAMADLKGKTGSDTFKSGKKQGQKHTSRYYRGGYKQFRADMGINQSYVDLQLFGDFRRDFSSSFQRETATTWTAGVKRIINQKKASGFVDKYGARVFQHTKKEIETLVNCSAGATVETLTP